MKKTTNYYITWGIILILWLLILFLIRRWRNVELSEKKLNETNLSNTNYLKDYLIKNYNWEFPYPKWDLTLLDKNLKQIHLEDKSINLESIDNLYIIQWTLGSLDISDQKFNQNTYDKRYSIWENKRYYTYSVTKDKKYFQIWTISKENDINKAYLVGNTTWSIIKDIESNALVENNSTIHLPYLPTTNNKYKISLIDWKIDNFEIKEDANPLIKKTNDEIKKWLFLPLWDSINELELTAKWKNYIYKITYPNGNIQMVSPNKNWDSSLKLSFKSDGISSNVSIVNTLWKIAYNMVKIWNDSQYQLQDDKWWVLVIRWTQFSLDIDEETTNTFLIQWTINLTKNNENYLLTINNNIAWFNKADQYLDMFKFPDRLKKLYSYWVAMDIFLNPPINHTISINKNIDFKQNSGLLYINQSNKIRIGWIYDIKNWDYEKYLWIKIDWYFWNEFAIQLAKDRKYANEIINEICQWLTNKQTILFKDISSFIAIDKINDENITFKLNKSIWEKINLNNYIIPIWNNAKDNSNLTFFDIKDWQIVYKSVSSNNENDKRNWIFIICWN